MADFYDVLTIGNAIVDILTHVDDAFLEKAQLTKGAMTLVDEERSEYLYQLMGPATEISGGSAANTAAGLASFGAKAAYIGKVCDDQLGHIFRHDIKAAGVHFETASSKNKPATARCMVFVTPDSQRTMQTYLGACVKLSAGDIVKSVVEKSKVTYLEGYLWDSPSAADACRLATQYAKQSGNKVALSLSDPYCVERHRTEFQHLCSKIDILFANEAEIMSLWQRNNLKTVIEQIGKVTPLVIITRGAAGSLVVDQGSVITIKPAAVRQIVDTTGAGDLYAAGFLYGIVRGYPLKACGEIASLAAGEIISHLGARPAVKLAKLLKDSGIVKE